MPEFSCAVNKNNPQSANNQIDSDFNSADDLNKKLEEKLKNPCS